MTNCYTLSYLRRSTEHCGKLRVETFLEYEQKCLERYWNVEEERKVYRRVKFGSYTSESKAEYFIRVLGETKLLSTSIKEAK